MPYVDNGGVRIHYATEGQGPPLLLYQLRVNSVAFVTPPWATSGRR